jgi:Heterokaryon incompatibility protein (HET)
MDMGLLPPTFRDGVIFCRQIGIDYLWIDSSCIIQKGDGEAEDWQRHLSEMSLIYANCILNISASHAASAEGGCFSTRKPDAVEFAVVHEWPESWDPEDQPPIPNRKSQLDNHYGFSSIKADIRSWPLSSRGWVFQERLLAPRVVYFGQNQLFWECSGLGLVTESIPIPIPQHPAADSLCSLGPFSLLATDEVDPHALWRTVVQNYSKKKLIKSVDRLPAIGGLAERMQRMCQDGYIAGFFKGQLPQALLWGISGLGNTIETPYIAPSWSWACVDGSISFAMPASNGTVLSVVNETKVSLVNELNQFGQIRHASITLVGPLADLAWNYSLLRGFKNSLLSNKAENGPAYYNERKAVLERGAIDFRWPFKTEDQGIVPDGIFFIHIDEAQWLKEECPSKVLLIATADVKPPDIWGKMMGLILSPVQAKGQDVYKRRGLFEFSPYSHKGVREFDPLSMERSTVTII